MFLDSFLSLYTNIMAPKPMSREDVLGFVVFCTVTCNGTSHVAEIVRFVTEMCAEDRETSSDVEDPRSQWMNSKDGVLQFYHSCTNMYDFLFAVSSGYYPKSPGTCCDPRYTFSNRGKRFPFEEKSSLILANIDESFVGFNDRERKSFNFVSSKYTKLKQSLSKLNGFRPMSAQEAIQ